LLSIMTFRFYFYRWRIWLNTYWPSTMTCYLSWLRHKYDTCTLGTIKLFLGVIISSGCRSALCTPIEISPVSNESPNPSPLSRIFLRSRLYWVLRLFHRDKNIISYIGSETLRHCFTNFWSKVFYLYKGLIIYKSI